MKLTYKIKGMSGNQRRAEEGLCFPLFKKGGGGTAMYPPLGFSKFQQKQMFPKIFLKVNIRRFSNSS